MVSDACTRPALRFRATSRYKLVRRTATRAGAIQVESGSSAVDSATKDPLMLRTIRGEKVERPPIWMMRQAGRYLPEYKATRAVAGDFMSLCKNAELACEVTLQPLRRFPLDAAILFSDILTIPDAMGLGLYFETGEGPRFKNPITCKADVDKIGLPDPEGELQYVMNAVRTIRRELKGEVPLIGFSGSPWTLATYMIEGGSSKAFTKRRPIIIGNAMTTAPMKICEDQVSNERIISMLKSPDAIGISSKLEYSTDIIMR
mgnify:CR=1 FL=1